MPAHQLLRLAQDLEWLGCELEYYGHKHALEGFPESGPNWETFREKQRGVLTTADKLDRELKSAVRFNPTALIGVEYPLEAALESVTNLLAAVEDIKEAAVFAVQKLPDKVRNFTLLVETYLNAVGALTQ
jgi:hypothetical protein